MDGGKGVRFDCSSSSPPRPFKEEMERGGRGSDCSSSSSLRSKKNLTLHLSRSRITRLPKTKGWQEAGRGGGGLDLTARYRRQEFGRGRSGMNASFPPFIRARVVLVCV